MKLSVKNIVLMLSLCFILSAPAFAIEEITENSEATLQDCIDFALSHSHYIKIYKERIELAKDNVGLAKSSYFPTVAASGGYDYDHRTGRDLNTSSNVYSAGVGLRQLIYSFGKVLSSVKMQKLNLIAAQYDYDDMVISTVNNVKKNFYAVIAAEANLDVQVSNVQINERQYARTKAFFDEGLVSRIDVVNQEVYLSDAKIQLLNAEKTYKLAFVALNEAMCFEDAPNYTLKSPENFKDTRAYINKILSKIGTNTTAPDGTERVPDNVLSTQVEKVDMLKGFEFKPFDKTLEECLEIAFKQRPDYLAVKAMQDYAEEYIKYTKRSYLPNLTGSATYNLINSQHYNTHSFGVGIDLSTSNLNFMEINLKIKQAESELEIAKQTTHEAAEDVHFSVEESYIALIEQEKKIPLLQEKVFQTLENYELADARYDVGLGNFIELQDAKVNYNNAQQAYIQAVHNYNEALVSLQSAMGER
ncbi:TolC family protein [bacterium]|nr:TolC family protein [bacterium]